jgi:hypothetical protein
MKKFAGLLAPALAAACMLQLAGCGGPSRLPPVADATRPAASRSTAPSPAGPGRGGY